MTDTFGKLLTATSTSPRKGITRAFFDSITLEANIEEGIDMKNQFENANLPEPTNLNDATTKRYVDAEYFDNIPIRDVNNDFIVSIFINKTLSSAAVFSIEVGKKYL